ncbi:hypothetical protein HSEST_3038 (plasmid) [Halapricum desulfuricans]|uniref:Uncharacterized protein n=1 Tax=Halapricum desulfuricans TaxID=2841257 RepID=A0A897NTS2_9EURY|nr:hypothetical protein HSEST_3038 [Halapricum desulfuricans]
MGHSDAPIVVNVQYLDLRENIMYIGVHRCSTGWVAVQFDEDGYEDTNRYEDV